ncbi:MAG: hypothetical protein ACE37H_03205, partial [Phycisphaeraceae bacterium]
DHGYVAERNNFTMAYLLHAIASQQLGRSDEASDYFNRVVTLDAALGPLVERLRAGAYNTVVVVADGLGPRKVATGPNGVLSRYQPIDALRAPARLYLNQQPRAELPVVTDVNQMALDHRWNNLEDVRVAKNVLGDLALAGGTIALLEGARREDATLAIIGAGVLAAGVFMKATARANTDYCDVFPQRLYLAALDVAQPGTDVTFELSGQPATSATLRNLEPPTGPQAAFHYVRAPIDVDLNPPPAPIASNANHPTNDPTPHPEGSLP